MYKNLPIIPYESVEIQDLCILSIKQFWQGTQIRQYPSTKSEFKKKFLYFSISTDTILKVITYPIHIDIGYIFFQLNSMLRIIHKLMNIEDMIGNLRSIILRSFGVCDQSSFSKNIVVDCHVVNFFTISWHTST